MELENQRVEYKREYTEELKKAIIAFANTGGGRICVGINDDLSVVGVANPDEVMLKMIKETAGDDYETARSLQQDLTFDGCKSEFHGANLKFESEQMRTLQIIGADGLYSNLGLLLSDQCVHTIKVAVFQGETKAVFKDRYEFTGSLFKQLHDCFDFIDRYNSTRAEINGLHRTDYRDYPEVAVRETLLNALVHRDYSFSASTLISIFDNRIEFVTLGGLLRGISLEDMKLGVSVLRNKNLANVFYRLKHIEAHGTGVIKILESYQNAGAEPLIEATDNAFKITLYNTQATTKTALVNQFSKGEQRICDGFRGQTAFKRKDVEALLQVSQPMATKYLKSLLDKKAIIKTGTGKNVVYMVV